MKKTSTVSAGTIKASKPRNPFGLGRAMPKAGPHQKPAKIKRKEENNALRKMPFETPEF